MIAVTGRKARPTSSESKPSTCCRYRAPRKNIPNIPATISAWIALAPERFRERKIRSGTSGLRGARLADDEGGEQGHRAGAEAERVGRAPAVVGGLDDRVDAHHQRGDDQQRRRAGRPLGEAEALVARRARAARGRR